MRVGVMWEKRDELLTMRATVFYTFCKQWIEYLGRPRKRLLQKSRREWKKNISQRYSSRYSDKRTDTSEITELEEAWFNNGWDVFIKGHIGLKNYTKVFRRISGRNNIRVKINSIYEMIYISWIKQIFSFIRIDR